MQMRKDDTFTSKNIIDAYCSAYYSVYNKQPSRIVHLGGKWFRVESEMRDRGWLMREIERMRHLALEVNSQDSGHGRGRLMKLIRGLRKLTGTSDEDATTPLASEPAPDETIMKRDKIKALAQTVARPQDRTNFQFGPQDTLIIQLDGESIAVRAPQMLVLGRDPALSGRGGIDLSHYAAEAHGVSRQHVQIGHVAETNYLEIVDLGSINGTYVNGQMLDPLMGYPLYDGDRLHLGALELQIRFSAARL